jgi:hypothetical protein
VDGCAWLLLSRRHASPLTGLPQCFQRGARTPVPLAWFEPAAQGTPASMALSEGAEDHTLREDIILAWTVFAARVRAQAKSAAARPYEGMMAVRFSPS